jgi:uncharacterized small protein (DUF1192 family)
MPIALFEDLYDRTPEEERKQKKPSVRRSIEKGFRHFAENLEEQKDRVEDELEAARKRLSSGNIEALKDIDLSFLSIAEIDSRLANMKEEKEQFLGYIPGV